MSKLEAAYARCKKGAIEQGGPYFISQCTCTACENKGASSKPIFYIYAYFRPNGSPCYIGKGKGRRWVAHLSKSHNQHLNSVLKDAGGSLPCLKIREGLTEMEAFNIEKALIAAVGRESDGGPLVNLSDGGEGCPGYSHTSEAREKIRATHKGKTHSPEHRARISASTKGRIISEDQRAKIGKASTGRQISEGTREKMRKASTGRFHSDSTKDKLRAINIGKSPPKEARARAAATRIGKPLSEGHRAKIGSALKNSSAAKAHLANLVSSHLGIPLSKEHRAKIGEAQKGKRASEKMRANMREAWKKRRESTEYTDSVVRRTATRRANKNAKGSSVSTYGGEEPLCVPG